MDTPSTELISAMLEAQRNIDHALKDSSNPFHKSKYANLESVFAAAKQAYNSNDILIQQHSYESDTGVIVETVFYGHGSSLSAGKVHVPANKSDPQAYGSAYTYARRYSLSLAAGIGGKDDDGEAAQSYVRKYKFTDSWGKTILFSSDSPKDYLSYCRENLGKPTNETCKKLYKTNKGNIELTLLDANGDTAEAFIKLQDAYA
jgi:hypothetical protein|tara:strand:- start:655 stop:1263 length:609 start_codon:yes stop_codon:yes gene_type:complete